MAHVATPNILIGRRAQYAGRMLHFFKKVLSSLCIDFVFFVKCLSEHAPRSLAKVRPNGVSVVVDRLLHILFVVLSLVISIINSIIGVVRPSVVIMVVTKMTVRRPSVVLPSLSISWFLGALL